MWAWALDVEVGVAGEVVRQEADADGHGDEAGGEGELLLFAGREELGAAAVTARKGLEHIHARIDLGEVLLILGRVGRGGAAHIAEVIERQARHHRVQVDHADAATGLVVQHHVVELGVVVRHALGDLALLATLQQTAEGVGARHDEVDLGLDVLGAVEGVLLDGGLERLVALHGVVEVGDRLMEAGVGEVRHHVLEAGEGLAHQFRLLRALDLVVGGSALDKDVHTPPVAIGVVIDRLAILGEDERQGATGDVRLALGAQLLGNVAGHAQNVLLHGLRLGKDVMVDALKQIVHLRAAHRIGELIGVIDVPAAIGAPAHKVAVNLERGGNRLQLRLRGLAKFCHDSNPFCLVANNTL